EEIKKICMQQSNKVDGKVQTDTTYLTGLIDVMGIDKTEENSYLMCDTKGPLLFIILHLRKPSTSCM
ncbi:ribosomal protein x-linked, partial [Lynx pardinus]